MKHDYAIIIGASIAGLLAARVASDHFASVIIIERDTLPDDDAQRAGTPQSRHVHGLLVRGLEIMRAMFPTLDDDLDGADVPRMEWMSGTIQHIPSGWAPRYASGLETRPVSRAALEAIIRRRVKAIPNVTFMTGVQVADLITNAEKTQVIGVHTVPRRATGHASASKSGSVLGEGANNFSLYADLIIDCTGRASKMPDWLGVLGYETPREEIINAHLGYATRTYQMDASFQPDWHALLMLPSVESPRGGVLTEIERGKWMMTLAGVGDLPPTDEAGLSAFVDAIAAPPLREALHHATPLTPIYGYRRTENRRLRYDKLKRMPRGLIVMGDAVAAFNPVYGQGMTAAALGAQVLDLHLRAQESKGFELAFQRQLVRTIAPMWLMAVTEDARYPTTDGVCWRGVYKLLNRYNDWLFARLPHSLTISQSFLRVLHVIDPPTAVMRPRVLWARLFARRAAEQIPGSAAVESARS